MEKVNGQYHIALNEELIALLDKVLLLQEQQKEMEGGSKAWDEAQERINEYYQEIGFSVGRGEYAGLDNEGLRPLILSTVPKKRLKEKVRRAV